MVVCRKLWLMERFLFFVFLMLELHRASIAIWQYAIELEGTR